MKYYRVTIEKKELDGLAPRFLKPIMESIVVSEVTETEYIIGSESALEGLQVKTIEEITKEEAAKHGVNPDE